MTTIRSDTWARLLMPAAFLVAGIVGAVQARGFTPVGQWFPFYTSLAIVVISTGIIVRELLALRRAGATDADAEPVPSEATTEAQQDAGNGAGPQFQEMLVWWLVIVLFAVLVYVVGLIVAAPAFVVLTLRLGAGMRWHSAAIAAAVTVGALWFLNWSLQLPFPEGLIG